MDAGGSSTTELEPMANRLRLAGGAMKAESKVDPKENVRLLSTILTYALQDCGNRSRNKKVCPRFGRCRRELGK